MTDQTSTKRVLVTVSGTIPGGIDAAVAAGERPRVDYLEMQREFDADLLDFAESERRHRWVGTVVHRVLGREFGLAWECFRVRRRYDVILTDGEQIGLPLGALMWWSRRRARPRHIMIVHILSVPKKVWLFRALRLGRRIDEMIVYATAQREFVVSRLRFPRAQVTLTSFMVDTAFFDPSVVTPATAPANRPIVCAAGLEFRDYPTLVDAVRDLDIDVVLAAASPWSKRRSELDDMDLPSNVSVVRLDLAELRRLYAEATALVMPLRETDFQAGVTTLLEAMAMSKPIICTRTTGQTDVITDGSTGIYVPPGDSHALRDTLVALLADTDRCAALGVAARAWVVQHAGIEEYVGRLHASVDRQLDAHRVR